MTNQSGSAGAKVAEELDRRHEELCALLVATLEPLEGQTDAERRQFIAGFLHVIASAGRDDFGPRDDYIESVIPGVKAAGMGMGYVLSVLVHLFLTLSPRVADPGGWLPDFARDYTKRLVNKWEVS
jgi:hypothetical protein